MAAFTLEKPKDVGKKKKIVTPKLPTIPKAVTPTIDKPKYHETGELTDAEIKVQQDRRAKMESALIKNSATPEIPVEAPVQETPVQEVKAQAPQVNIADMMRQASTSETDSLVSAVKQRIAESKAQQQQLIAKAPQAYDPLRAESEVRKSQELRTALERSSLLCDRGGIGRSEALATQTAGEGRLTDINLQQQNFIDQAKAEIVRLESQGRYEEAQIVADQARQLSQNLITEQIRQEGIQREDASLERQRSESAFEQQKQDFVATINRYAQDFTAQIQSVQNDGDPSNDWQIPLLESARQDKITSQNLDPLTGQPLPVDQTPQLTSSSALDLWEQTGVANEAISRALGIPTGTRYTRQSTGGRYGGTADTGLSDTAIRYKISNGIPLSAEEAAKYGVEEGYTLPTEEVVQAPELEDEPTFKDSVLNKSLNTYLGDTDDPVAVKNLTTDWIVESVKNGSMTEQQMKNFMESYGIKEEDIAAKLVGG